MTQQYPILLTVGAIDEQAKQAIATVGGRVESIHMPLPCDGDANRVIDVFLVALPREVTAIGPGYPEGHHDITIVISPQREMYLELALAETVEETEISFIDDITYKEEADLIANEQ